MNALLRTLFPELFQTERSARRHPAREAARLVDGPAAAAMRAVAADAEHAEHELRRLAEARGLAAAEGGSAVGRLFSELRDKAADRVIDAEKSYRGTLLGLHHGVGVVRLLADAARAGNDGELAASCERWLARRVPLVETAEAALRYFAERPDVALAPAAGGALWRAVRRWTSLRSPVAAA